jgi:CBS domain-containing protein
MSSAPRAELALFLHRVRELVKRPAVSCPTSTSAAAAACHMWRERVGSVIVVDDAGKPCGIVTDRDLRRKIVAAGRDSAATTVAQIMSAPLATIGPSAYVFEAAIEMTRREIHHLAVLDEGRLVGVVSSDDVFAMQVAHPVTLARTITTASSLDALAAVAGQVTVLVARLVEEGAAAYEVGRIVAELNDRMVQRVLGLTMDALAAAGETPPPLGWCWIALGSEARREQTLRTDQDNGLVYADPPADLAEPAARFYRRFGEAAIEGLVRIGFPRCPGDSMASNPRWCRPLSAWMQYFRGWMSSASPDNVLAASIYFDLRPLAGATELAASLAAIVQAEAPREAGFLATMARDVASRPVPLTLFGNVRVPRAAPQRGRVDVKGGGTMQLVGAARVLALQLGLRETNSIDRFRAAAAAGALGGTEVGELTDAFQLLMRLRLRHQLAQLDRGEAPDNLLVVGKLSHADALLFRDALQIVRRLQASIRDRFAIDFMR